ncbi:opacity protein-like surface antigen [Paraburkholderia youngii]
MKKIALAALMAFAASAQAGTGIVGANNEFTLSGGIHNLDYSEHSPTAGEPSTLDSESGNQGAFGLAWTHQGTILNIPNVYLSVSGNFIFGSTSYSGYLQDGYGNLYPYDGSTQNNQQDFQLRIGQSYPLGANRQFQLTPYFTYSYHHWKRQPGGEYNEDYSHNGLGVGLLGQYAPTPYVVLSADVSVQAMLGAQIKVDGYPTMDLQNRPIKTLTLGADYAVTPRFHVNGSYRFTSFDYGGSTPVVANGMEVWEPDSRTRENLFMVGVSWAY